MPIFKLMKNFVQWRKSTLWRCQKAYLVKDLESMRFKYGSASTVLFPHKKILEYIYPVLKMHPFLPSIWISIVHATSSTGLTDRYIIQVELEWCDTCCRSRKVLHSVVVQMSHFFVPCYSRCDVLSVHCDAIGGRSRSVRRARSTLFVFPFFLLILSN
jgi:hypothetical protein